MQVENAVDYIVDKSKDNDHNEEEQEEEEEDEEENWEHEEIKVKQKISKRDRTACTFYKKFGTSSYSKALNIL